MKTIRDTIITKLHNLPESVLNQVNDFIDLVALKDKSEIVNGSSQEDIRADWKQWFDANSPSQDEGDRLINAERVLQETDGSWGHLSLDEIDAKLAQQRQFDWGE